MLHFYDLFKRFFAQGMAAESPQSRFFRDEDL